MFGLAACAHTLGQLLNRVFHLEMRAGDMAHRRSLPLHAQHLDTVLNLIAKDRLYLKGPHCASSATKSLSLASLRRLTSSHE
jgi:hypothetical protein